MIRLRFQWRLLLMLLGLLLAVQTAVWFAVDAATQANAREHAEDRLSVGSRVFRQLLDARGAQLLDSVAVIVADFGFKQAVATGDTDTIQSMLLNHGSRVGASSVLLLDNAGAVIASTEAIDDASDLTRLSQLIGSASNQRQRLEILPFLGRPTQMAVVPVRAPVRVGWVAMNFVLDDPLLARLRTLTGLEVSLLPDPSSLSGASTLSDAARSALPAYLKELSNPLGSVQLIHLADVDYLAMGVPLADMTAVLQLDSDQVLRGFTSLRERLLWVLLSALVLAAIAATALARGVSQPLLRLAQHAEQIGRGDYQSSIEVPREDELGVLADSLNRMQSAVAAREATIAHQAFHDALTGLPNRLLAQRHLSQSLAQAHARQGAVAVLMIDLDRFKEINDTLGHATGDQVLIQAAARIRTALRPDDLLARLGGDEFLIVVDDCDGAAGQQLAHAVLTALAMPLELQAMELFLDASIGVASFPGDHQDAAGLIRQADIAMYDAKQSGAHCARYESGRDASQKERLALVNDLRRAIPRGELRLQFQPKWDLASGTVGHAEALVRWQHPERGLLGPDKFIPLAEHSGRIRELTDWVLREAIRSAAIWQDQGIAMGIAVNLSVLDLMSSDLPDRVRALLAEFRLAPRHLLLEITESAVMRDANHALAVLHRLREIGIELAIDDFGTGYSSLSHLQRLPVSEIKIDKSFVLNLAHCNDDDVIVRSTIELGHNMGLRVVAEGVEDAATLARLHALDCDQVQGFLVARPMHADAVPEWYRTQPAILRSAT